MSFEVLYQADLDEDGLDYERGKFIENGVYV